MALTPLFTRIRLFYDCLINEDSFIKCRGMQQATNYFSNDMVAILLMAMLLMAMLLMAMLLMAMLLMAMLLFII